MSDCSLLSVVGNPVRMNCYIRNSACSQPHVGYPSLSRGRGKTATHLYHSPGLTWSLNGNSIPTNNVARISVYDFDANGTFDGSLRAESERPVADVEFSNGCIIGNGTSVINCAYGGVGHITHYGGNITRGWDTRRVEENGRRVHYLRRQEQTPEEGYYSCHLQGDTNSPRGLYILYPSEWPSLMI